MYADEGQVTFIFNEFKVTASPVRTSVHHFEQLCRYSNQSIVSFISISGTTEPHRSHRHAAAGWSAIGLHDYISSVCFRRDAELSVWLMYLPLAIREVLLLPRHAAVKQGNVLRRCWGQATRVAQYYIRPSQTC